MDGSRFPEIAMFAVMLVVAVGAALYGLQRYLLFPAPRANAVLRSLTGSVCPGASPEKSNWSTTDSPSSTGGRAKAGWPSNI